MGTRLPRYLGAVVAAALAAAPACAATAWWNYDWKCRRGVAIAKAAPTGLPGDDVAVVSMSTGGRTRSDARDVRVVTARRREVPSQVLMIGPGDQVRVAFALRPGTKDYYVYFGNPAPPRAPGQLAITRGVLLSTWKHPGGNARTLSQAKGILAKAKTFIGRDFRDRIFMGHNPFGPEQALASTFVGYVNCPKAGAYTFSTSSQNASFLTVDDTLVVANGGSHGPQRDIRKRGQVTLKAGLHKLTFYHVSPWGSPIAVVAWQPPGEKRIRVISPKAFAPVVFATAGAMEELGKACVDFTPVHAGEAFMINRYYQRYTFEAVQTGATVGKQVTSWRWDFGDGETGSGKTSEHVYFQDGMVTVTLTGKTRTGTLTCRNAIYITRPWRTVTRNRLDSTRAYANIAAGYAFNKLSSAAMVDAACLFQRTGHTNGLMKVGAAFVSRRSAEKKTASVLVPIYAKALVSAGQADKALKALVAGAKLESDAAGSAQLLVLAGRVCVEHLNDARGGMTLFKQVVARYGKQTSVWVRRARIGVGDAYRLVGDAAKAAEAYRAAGTAPPRKAGGQVLSRGNFARQIEDYVRRGDLEEAKDVLEQWQDAFPGNKLDGYWSLLRVKTLVRGKAYLPAAREAEVLARVSPTSHHVPELLMLAVEAYRQAGRRAQADATLKRIITDYAESGMAAKAAAMLKR